jgi:hypothetical protein
MSDYINALRTTVIEWKKTRHVSYAETLEQATDKIEELEGLVNDIIVDVTEAIETGRSVEDVLCWAREKLGGEE